jgi:hypothetical protein
MKNVLSVSLVALALTACHSMPCHDNDDHGASLDPTNPQVNIVGGKYLVVNQEPLQFPAEKRGQEVTITWHLPQNGGYLFTENGITVVADSDKDKDSAKKGDASGDIVNCRPAADRTEYKCQNTHKHVGTFKYTVTVEKNGEQLKLDPSGDNH